MTTMNIIVKFWDPVAQKVYFKALKSILHVRDSLCPICLATLYAKDARCRLEDLSS